MSDEDWQVGHAKSLGVFLHGAAIQRPGEQVEAQARSLVVLRCVD